MEYFTTHRNIFEFHTEYVFVKRVLALFQLLLLWLRVSERYNVDQNAF